MALGASTMWRDVRVLAETGSTSSDLAALARAGAPEGTVVVADHQAAGRGRLDRTWLSPPGTGIAVSMLFRPSPVPAAHWPWLPLLTGVAVAGAVRTVSGISPGLKWPNDVVLGGGKLAGILAEVVPEGAGAVVVGVGLNVSTTAADLPPTGTSLALCGAPGVDRLDVLAAMLTTVEKLYDGWCRTDGDTAAAVAAYRPLCTTLGATVQVTVPGGADVEGVAVDVDAHGRLVVRTDTGDRTLSVGDVVHVRQQ